MSFSQAESISKEPVATTARDLQTVCVLCSHNCGLRVDVKGGIITAVRPDKENVITHGYICNKSVTIGQYVDHAQRVEAPLKRQPDGSFKKIDWDTAITEVVERLKNIREQYAPSSIGLAGAGGQGNHLDGPFVLRLLSALGSKRFFNSWAQEKTQHSLVSQWLFDSPPTVFVHPDTAHTRFHMVIGSNPRISNRGHNANQTYRDMARSADVTLVVIDPRETETTRQADEHVRLQPGTDVWFLSGLIAHIIQTPGLSDDEFLLANTNGLDAFKAEFSEVDVNQMSERCRVPVEQLRWVAKGYATAESASLLHDLGAEQIPFSTVIAYLLQVLAVVTGNIGRDGGSIFSATMKPPVLHPRRHAPPERALASGIQAIASQGIMGMFSPTLIPEEILADHPDRLRALIVEGANPWLSFSDTNVWREARKKLDLLVVVDPAMTETALQADYVLPVPTGYEKWEWSDFVKGYPAIKTQVRPPVVAPRGDVLPEPEIHVRLMEKLGFVPEPSAALKECARKALTPEGAGDFITLAREEANKNSAVELCWTYRLVGPLLPAPGLVAIWQLCFVHAQMRRDAVLATLGEGWKQADHYTLGCEIWRRIIESPGGVEIARLNRQLNLEQHIGWEDKKIRLLPEGIVDELRRALRSRPVSDPEYPVRLAAGLRTRWTANTIQREPGWRKGKEAACSLHLSPADAYRLSLGEGNLARVSTRAGSVALAVEIDKRVADGNAWIPNGFGMWKPGTDPKSAELDGVNVNELTDVTDRDPITGCPHHKSIDCRIEAV